MIQIRNYLPTSVIFFIGFVAVLLTYMYFSTNQHQSQPRENVLHSECVLPPTSAVVVYEAELKNVENGTPAMKKFEPFSVLESEEMVLRYTCVPRNGGQFMCGAVLLDESERIEKLLFLVHDYAPKEGVGTLTGSKEQTLSAQTYFLSVFGFNADVVVEIQVY